MLVSSHLHWEEALGIKDTFFALLMSIDNFENLWLAILIRNVLRLSSLWILFLVCDPSSSILPTKMLSSKDETETEAEAKESNNIELVSLVNSVDGR
ncbi:hypothetical protein Gogos_004660 [Gossypium gossypioides]|uniref:Uncharacterized protein n=1 Tax=Gossypium gossypioides TaxID=34282 RepID=A0A7J9CHJ9_GOSGO|nr:hypothetical protein [Gossypium gossypioides]